MIGYAAREINVHSWWLAAELVRRHPELHIHEAHPGGGMYDVLMVLPNDADSSECSLPKSRVMLNRAGSLQVHASDARVVAQWPDLKDPDARFEVLQRLEAQAGWDAVMSTPPSTPRTLTYRFLATALELMQYDRANWDSRNEFFDSSGYGVNPDQIRHFASALKHVRTVTPIGIPGEPLSYFWTLSRGDEPALIVSIDGTVHLREGRSLDLMDQYQKHGRRLRWMTASLLRDWL